MWKELTIFCTYRLGWIGLSEKRIQVKFFYVTVNFFFIFIFLCCQNDSYYFYELAFKAEFCTTSNSLKTASVCSLVGFVNPIVTLLYILAFNISE